MTFILIVTNNNSLLNAKLFWFLFNSLLTGLLSSIGLGLFHPEKHFYEGVYFRTMVFSIRTGQI